MVKVTSVGSRRREGSNAAFQTRGTVDRPGRKLVRSPSAHFPSRGFANAHSLERTPWPLCEEFIGATSELESEPRVFLHGEYAPRNIICRRGRVIPIDWESVATGPGELDLGSLLDGWSLWVVRIAARAYADARWPEGTPPGFRRRLELARLFIHLRWLGDNPEWTTDAESSWRFPAMQEIGVHLGLI